MPSASSIVSIPHSGRATKSNKTGQHLPVRRDRPPGRLGSLVKEFGRFSLVGALRTLVGVGLLYLLPNVLGVDFIVSNVIVYTIGLAMGFLLHKNWVFQSRKMWKTEILPYLVSFAVGYLFNVGLLLLQVNILGMNKNVAQVIAMAGFSLVNYVVNKAWTFRDRTDPTCEIQGKE